MSDLHLHTANCPIFDDITNGTSEDHKIFPDKVEDLQICLDGKTVGPVDESTKHMFNIDGDNKFNKSSWVKVFEDRILPSVKDSLVLNCSVTEISYEGEKVTAKTKSGQTYEADKAIVCVPISALVKERLKFSPALPAAKAAAIKKTKTTPGMKVFLEFKEKFYPHFVLMKPFDTPGLSMYMDETVGKTTEKHILCRVVLGTEFYQQVTAKGTDNEKVKEFCLAELDKMFDGKATASFLNCVVQNWETEEFIECGGPDTGDSGFDPVALAAPLDGKVFFAGDAMNPEPHNNLYVQGACETSYIAVKGVLAGL